MKVPSAPAWVIVGALAAYVWPRPAPTIDYPRVFVHREVIERLEPDTVVRFVERIRYVIPKPLVVATAIGGGRDDVDAFCAPTIAARDTAAPAPPAPMLLLRSGSIDRGWPLFGTDRMRLTGPTSAGDLKQATYGVRGSASFVTAGDSVIVRFDRWARVKEVVTAVGIFTAGYLVGDR